jgi:hypothetical protein
MSKVYSLLAYLIMGESFQCARNFTLSAHVICLERVGVGIIKFIGLNKHEPRLHLARSLITVNYIDLLFN